MKQYQEDTAIIFSAVSSSEAMVTGWWFGDTSGWYAKNTTIKINDVWYKFNAAGYWVP